MQIKPNKTILEGNITHIDRAADGWGAHVQIMVERVIPVDGFADFLRAKPGSIVTVFAARSDAIKLGGRYALTVTVLGGPQGERVVLQDASPR
jgi:hypothetical protein